jgi:hypothetical protein
VGKEVNVSGFKVGDIVRYVVHPDWEQYATDGSVLEVRRCVGKNGSDIPAYKCSLLLGDWTERGEDAKANYNGEGATFLECELEAIHDEVQGG